MTEIEQIAFGKEIDWSKQHQARYGFSDSSYAPEPPMPVETAQELLDAGYMDNTLLAYDTGKTAAEAIQELVQIQNEYEVSCYVIGFMDKMRHLKDHPRFNGEDKIILDGIIVTGDITADLAAHILDTFTTADEKQLYNDDDLIEDLCWEDDRFDNPENGDKIRLWWD